MQYESERREIYIIVGDFRDRLGHAVAAMRRLMRTTSLPIERVDAMYRSRPETGVLRLLFRLSARAEVAGLCLWAAREGLGFVDPSALPGRQRVFFFDHYLARFRPMVRSFTMPQVALCSLGRAIVQEPPAAVLAVGTGVGPQPIVLEWKPGVRMPSDSARDRCAMSGSIGGGGDVVTPTA